MSNSTVASLPAKVKIANFLPGCWEKKLDTLRTRPCKTTQTSPILTACTTMKKIRKTALRVSPVLSFEILKFFAKKIVAQIS